MSAFAVNGREYRPPERPLVAICLDGSADEYIDAAMDRGLMPNLRQMAANGFRGMARSALPSFTNVNNTSIITGVPPSVHGIGGNFFFDPVEKREVMMNSAAYLRCGTVLAAARKAGRKVGVVTAKEKLRDIFACGVVEAGADDSGIAFSSEKAGGAQKPSHGIDGVEKLVGRPTPEIYSGEASVYVLRSGVALLAKGLADFLYLSTTDFIQHMHEPAEKEALNFYREIDAQIGELLRLGAVVGVTADHGMNAKQKADGSPNVIYLEEELTRRFGQGFRVILPITDPYVVHHGALGSFAVVHIENKTPVADTACFIGGLAGVTEIRTREEAGRHLELPLDRIGDLMVLSDRTTVLGRNRESHDLSALRAGLRSHGGRYEEMVPFFISEMLNKAYHRKALGDVRNFDLFDFLANGTSTAA